MAADPIPAKLHGWLILDKPVGLGSTQAVGAVKRALRDAGLPRHKVGHGGTLDPLASGVLPIALGMITLANVESSRWFVSAAVREREDAEEKRVAEQRAQGRIVLEPRKIVQSGLRFLSVGRILIGAVVPGVRAPLPSLFHRYFWNFFFFCRP